MESLYAGIAPAPTTDRKWAFPDAADNPLGAWYVTTQITGSPTGPLAGSQLAVKDNIAVAGVLMMNGSRTVEGFVPLRGNRREAPAGRWVHRRRQGRV